MNLAPPISSPAYAFISPRTELSSRYEKCPDALRIYGNGDVHAFGCWRSALSLQDGHWYRASVRVRLTGIFAPKLQVFAQAARHFMTIAESDSDTITLCCEFLHTSGFPATLDFYLRSTVSGEAAFFEPCVEEIDSPIFRYARVATVRFGEAATGRMELSEQRRMMTRFLNDAGALSPDIVCLTELACLQGLPHIADYAAFAEIAPEGETCRLYADAARRHGMYVLGGIVRREGKHLYNSCVLFDRNGAYVGVYDKTHLTFGELEYGFSSGSDYPVFSLDFGRVAVMICYDEWFPEVARYYAHAGADVLFLPVQGGKPITWRTRALDSAIYLVAASWTPPSMILHSTGEILAETHSSGVVYADLNLSRKPIHAYEDPTLSNAIPAASPYKRNVTDDRLLRLLYESMTH